MDPPRDFAAFSSRSSPQSPFPPLALSDFLSQRPVSSYGDDDDDRIAATPVTTPTKEQDVGPSQLLSGNHQPPVRPGLHGPNNGSLTLPREITGPTHRQDPLTVNWQAKRSQLPPSKNLGKKGDWVRSWSEAVSAHGDTAYCACSEPLAAKKDRSGRNRELTSRLRGILHRTAPAQQPPSIKSEPNVCRNCGRPASPAVSVSTVRKDAKMVKQPPKKKRLGRFWDVVRGRWSDDEVTPPPTGGPATEGTGGTNPVGHVVPTAESTSSPGTSSRGSGDHNHAMGRNLARNKRFRKKAKEVGKALNPAN